MDNYFSPDTREEWRAAFRALRSVAPGKSRDEVRALYLAELGSRGISRPPDRYLEMDVTRIINASRHQASPGAASHRRPPSPLLSRLAVPVRAVRNAKKIRGLLPQYQPGHRVRFIDPDRSAEPIRVVLEPGASQWLAVGRHLPRGADPATRIDVWLDFSAVAQSDRLVRVHVRDQLVGVLPAEDGTFFWAEIEDAQRDGYILMTSGFIERGDESSIGFYVYRFATDE
jgi:hypothetical protein